MSDRQLETYCVYKGIAEYPDKLVIKRFLAKEGMDIIDPHFEMIADKMEYVDEFMLRMGKAKLWRADTDAENIVCTYL